MQQETEENIIQFIDYFKDQIYVVKNAKFKQSDKLFKKILYLSFIDTLAKTVARRKDNNKTRFISFVEKFGNWDHGNRVSLPQLNYYLESKQQNIEFRKIYDFTNQALSNWGQGQRITLESDPVISELERLWPQNLDNNHFKSLGSFQHLNLLYSYRNALVHEYRKLGYGSEAEGDSAPFYHGLEDIDNGYSWELVYPLGFFENILKNILIELKSFYTEKQINPHDSFKYGSHWM